MRQSLQPPEMTPDYKALLSSDRLSARTRDALVKRAEFNDQAYQPLHLSPRAFASLEVLTILVLPQADILDQRGLSLAARIDMRLGGPGDGWRFAELPPDLESYENVLCDLDDICQKEFGARLQDVEAVDLHRMIEKIEASQLDTPHFNAKQLKLWFSDLCADCVQIFITHPAVQSKLGIDALFNGGDAAFHGFKQMGDAGSEPWEPEIVKRPDAST